ncbi:MAG TPA: extracellular solute-binding protein [Acidimicrobiales bacterium]|nr:extracellular solute-binding protein [Acidimicrobiales bacterium]
MPRRLRRRALVSLAAAAATLVAAGCSSSSKPAATSAAPTGGGSSPTTVAAAAAAQKTVPLVVYSAQGYDSAVTKAFQAATGIPVQLDDDSTGPLLTKIAAERNNPQWGLLWVDGDTAFAALDKQGQLASYLPNANFTAAGRALIPADHTFAPSGTTIMAALIYNAAATSAVPTSYQDLTTAPFKGKVGMNDPSQSGPTFPFIAGLMNQLGGESGGVQAGYSYFEKLKSNGLHVYPTNGDTLHALETGQIDYGLIQSSAATGEVLKAAKSSSFDPKVVYLPVPTLLPGVMGIDKAAPPAEQAEAQKFEDYVLSPAGQKAMQGGDPTGDSLYYPVVSGVQPLPGLPPLPANYQRIDPYFWGPLEGQVNSWFDSNIK